MNDEKTVLAAVSGGPDSMALLDWLSEQGFSVVIAHVNYNRRPTASRDEAIVRRWAVDHHQPLWILSPKKEEGSGNFQAWAREVRYAFFEAVASACGIDRIYLGHHQDDHIETWMLQKERGTLPQVYGLQTESIHPDTGLHLIRPFLDRTKASLQKLCDEKGIAYGIDESNLGDHYRRNQIRHARIEPAGSKQRKAWLEQIEQDNQALRALRSRAGILLKKALEEDAGCLYEQKEGWLALEMLIHEKTGLHSSAKSMQDLLDKLESGSLQTLHHLRLQLVQDAKPNKAQGRLAVRADQVVPFWIDSKAQLEELVKKNWSYGPFQLTAQGKTIESFSVGDSDFPLCIRPARQGERIVTRYGTKKISRLLIDRRIPAILRDRCPVIEGRNGILFATLCGCDPNHYSPVENGRFYMVEYPV